MSENGLQLSGITSNVGIASYVCEALCSNLREAISPELVYEISTALIQKINQNAINYQDYVLWRWEANPARPDYYYPPDWDDTCKAIDAIRAYENRFDLKWDIPLPKSNQVKQMLESSTFKSSTVGEDIKIEATNDLCLYMFLANKQQKTNNTEDIHVTAVTVRTIYLHYSDLTVEMEGVLSQLVARLIESATLGLKNNIPFCSLSRCYFSWGYYLLLLMDISNCYSSVRDIVEALAEEYLNRELYREIEPYNLRGNLIYSEYKNAALLATQLESKNRGQIISEIETFSEKPFQIVYQHRRLNHFYGSPAWSRLLDLQILESYGLVADLSM